MSSGTEMDKLFMQREGDLHIRKSQMPKQRSENEKCVSRCHKAQLVCWCRRREGPDFFHKRVAQWDILAVSRIEQVRDAMGGNFVCLKVEVEERGSDDEAVDHDAGLANSEVSTMLHDMLGILVCCNIIVANQGVHKT